MAIFQDHKPLSGGSSRAWYAYSDYATSMARARGWYEECHWPRARLWTVQAYGWISSMSSWTLSYPSGLRVSGDQCGSMELLSESPFPASRPVGNLRSIFPSLHDAARCPKPTINNLRSSATSKVYRQNRYQGRGDISTLHWNPSFHALFPPSQPHYQLRRKESPIYCARFVLVSKHMRVLQVSPSPPSDDRGEYFAQGSGSIWSTSIKRLTLKDILAKSFEALLSGVSTGINTVMAASTATLQWQKWIRLSNKDRALDGNRF